MTKQQDLLDANAALALAQHDVSGSMFVNNKHRPLQKPLSLRGWRCRCW